MLGFIWGLLQHVIVDNALMVGAVAGGVILAVFAPQRFKDYGVALAAFALVAFLIFNDGVSKGKADVQARWDNAERAAVLLGEKARADAEAAIPPLVEPAPVPIPVSRPPVSAGGKPGRLPACKPVSRYDRCR